MLFEDKRNSSNALISIDMYILDQYTLASISEITTHTTHHRLFSPFISCAAAFIATIYKSLPIKSMSSSVPLKFMTSSHELSCT